MSLPCPRTSVCLQEPQEVRGKGPGLCQTDAILITFRQPFSEEIKLSPVGVAKIGGSLRWA